MSNTIKIDRPESLRDARIRWSDESGPIDLSGCTIAVIEAAPTSLMAASVEISDPVAGLADLNISSAIVETLRNGRANWLRLCIMRNGEPLDATPKIWIEVT